MTEANDFYRQSVRAASLGLALSLALGTIKLLGGWLGHSLALMTDAAHSLVDAALSIGLIAALNLARRPPDGDHPYGHGRAEALAGAGTALVLLALALGIAWNAAVSVNRPHPVPQGFTLAIALASAVFQEGLFRYASRVARRTGSRALLGTAWDYRLDALGGLAVAAGVALAAWGGPSWTWADHAAALAVAATIFWVGAGLLWDNVQGLMDHQAEPEVVDAVRREALAVPGVLGVEKLRVRRAGLEFLVDIHIEVDPDWTVRAGHDVAHAVKARVIASSGPLIRDVLVHIEPHSVRPSASRSGPAAMRPL